MTDLTKKYKRGDLVDCMHGHVLQVNAVYPNYLNGWIVSDALDINPKSNWYKGEFPRVKPFELLGIHKGNVLSIELQNAAALANSNKPNSAQEIIFIVQSFIEGKRIECAKSITNRHSAWKLDHSYFEIRTDIPAHELFDFKNYSYRLIKQTEGLNNG